MKRILLLVGIVAATFSSCSRDVVQDINRGNAIEFRTSTSTRATEINSLNDLSGIVATAYNESGSVYFSGVTFAKSTSSTYTSSESYYWPNDDSNLYFYSYGPEINNPAEFSSANKTLSYEPAAAVSNQIDLLAAVGSGKNGDESVQLDFKHILSQINISAKIDSSSPYTYKVKGVRIGNAVSSGTYTYQNVAEGETPTNDSWAGGNDLTNYTIKYENAITLNASSQSLMGEGDEGCAMVIPQSGNAWQPTVSDDTGRYIAVLVNIKSGNTPVLPTALSESGEDLYAWVAIPIDTNWDMNTCYNYTIDFTKGAGYVAPPDEDDEEDDDIVKPGADVDNIGNSGEEVLKGSDVFFTTTMGHWTTPEESATANEMIGVWTVNHIERYNDIDYPKGYPDEDHYLEYYEPNITGKTPSKWETEQEIKDYMNNGIAFKEFKVFNENKLGGVDDPMGSIGFHIEVWDGKTYTYIDTYLDTDGPYFDSAGNGYNQRFTIEKLDNDSAIIRNLFINTDAAGDEIGTYDVEYIYYNKYKE